MPARVDLASASSPAMRTVVGSSPTVPLVWSGVGSAILYKVVDVIVGLRATVEVERESLDLVEHTERAYNM